jgi:hypothetical protein
MFAILLHTQGDGVFFGVNDVLEMFVCVVEMMHHLPDLPEQLSNNTLDT